MNAGLWGSLSSSVHNLLITFFQITSNIIILHLRGKIMVIVLLLLNGLTFSFLTLLNFAINFICLIKLPFLLR